MSAQPTGCGTLFLVPTYLSETGPASVLPPEVVTIARTLTVYIAENAKTARAFLKTLDIGRPIAEIEIIELDKHTRESDATVWLAPLKAGKDVGLVSEAGVPAVADPGAAVVAAAHAAGIRVRPLVGPSSLLLALMASGLNGQLFQFHGYLAQDGATRLKQIEALEADSRKRNCTQMMIETPYRNQAMLADLLRALKPGTRLCVASDLTGADESVMTLRVDEWRLRNVELRKQPAIFLLLA